MEFGDLIQRAVEIREKYVQLERQRHGRSWSREELALGFVGDVGDLMKLVTAREGVRDIPDAEEKLAHELADCLWSVVVLARAYEVDLERAFVDAMDELDAHISGELDDCDRVA